MLTLSHLWCWSYHLATTDVFHRLTTFVCVIKYLKKDYWWKLATTKSEKRTYIYLWTDTCKRFVISKYYVCAYTSISKQIHTINQYVQTHFDSLSLLFFLSVFLWKALWKYIDLKLFLTQDWNIEIIHGCYR